jgi:hypothetical protein
MLLRRISATTSFHEQERKQTDADQHMQSVNTSHEEIKDPEQLKLMA